MGYTLKHSIVDVVTQIFQKEDIETVLFNLRESKLPMDQSAPPPRVHIAIIWLSEGNLKNFHQVLKRASSDWRDTLVCAGLGNEDWKEILTQKNIDCSDW